MMHDTQNVLAVGGLALVVVGFVTAKQNLAELRGCEASLRKHAACLGWQAD
ncbi:MAG: hypothetical protein ABI129_03185 [Rhodanobacter sp.]